MLVKVVRESPIGDALPSKIYIDGVFFGYGLENDLYKIPNGVYSAYAQTSPKFGTNKVYIDVPERTAIMFHGGNYYEQSKGCILVGRNRDGETISGDLSDELFNVVDAAYRNGEQIAVKVCDNNIFAAALILAGVAAIMYLVAR